MAVHPSRQPVVTLAAPPPERLELEVTGRAAGCALRRCRLVDLASHVAAIHESLEHLQPWMPWAAQPVTEQTQTDFLTAAEDSWDRRADFGYAILDPEGSCIGGAGLHTRLGVGVLEIGYWVHVSWTRLGLATAAARQLTAAGLDLAGIASIVIRHDAENVASGRVPRALGYRCDGTSVPAEGPTAGRPTTWWSTGEPWTPPT